MKKVFVASSLMAACVSAMSQGYAGAVYALSRIDGACQGQETCDHRGRAVRAYFGANLSASNQIDLGIGKVAAVEFGLMNFGKGGSTGQGTYTVDVNAGPITVPTQRSTTANALTFAVASVFPFGGGAFRVWFVQAQRMFLRPFDTMLMVSRMEVKRPPSSSHILASVWRSMWSTM